MSRWFGLKQAALKFFFNARPCVVDCDYAVRVATECNRISSSAELQGIAQKIMQYAAQKHLVAISAAIRSDAVMNRYAFQVPDFGDFLDYFVSKLLEIKLFAISSMFPDESFSMSRM